MGLAASKWHDWKHPYGKVNEHNAWVPRDYWLEATEKQAILDFHDQHSLEGYRRLTFLMLDADVVACSPASVYRVLTSSGVGSEQASHSPSVIGLPSLSALPVCWSIRFSNPECAYRLGLSRPSTNAMARASRSG
jgi:hypothetical protein